MVTQTIETPDRKKRLGRRGILRASGTLMGAALLRKAPIAAASGATAPASSLRKGSAETTTYQIEGRLLEVCTCNVLCPCWVGENPDGGTCDSAMAWRIDKGQIKGVDVAGRTFALSVHIPGNVLAGNWRAVVYVDDASTQEQQDALLQVFTGQLGGAIADLAGLIGEVIAVERAPITFTVQEGKGTLTIGDFVDAELAPFQGATGETTALHDTVFSTIPGAPAYVGKASRYQRDETNHGLSAVDRRGSNAIQGLFHFEA
jgi:hypothetical protein